MDYKHIMVHLIDEANRKSFSLYHNSPEIENGVWKKPIGYEFSCSPPSNIYDMQRVSLTVWHHDFCIFWKELILTKEGTHTVEDFEQRLAKEYLLTSLLHKTDFQSKVESGEIKLFDEYKHKRPR